MAKKDTSTEVKNCLIDKTIKIVPLNKIRTNVYKDKPGGTEAVMLTGSSVIVTCPPDANGKGKLVKVLNNDEQEYLEGLLNIDLNPWKDPKENFFANNKDSMLRFTKYDSNLDSAALYLDLSNPYDYIKYKIALASPRIANNWAERNNSMHYEFVIKDEDAEFVDELKDSTKSAEVIGFIANHRSDEKTLLNVLRLFNLDIAYDKKVISKGVDYVFNELWKLANDKKNLNDLYKIVKLEDPERLKQLFISDAIYAGAISKQGREYKLFTKESIGFSMDEAIANLNKPENNNIKLKVTQMISEFKNTK